MARRRQVYNGNWNFNIAAGGSQQATFKIVNANRELVLREILFQIIIVNNTTGLVVPEISQTDLFYYVAFGTSLPAGVVGQSFEPVTPPAPLINDRRIFLFKANQYFFNDIQFSNEIQFNFDVTNYSAATIYNMFASIDAEVEILTFEE